MKEVSKKRLPIIDADYQNWIGELKRRYRQSQIKAAIRVNSELIRFYWSLGRDIVQMKSEARWGSGFYERLSADLSESLPDSKGFSEWNLRHAKQFYELFPENEILEQVVPNLLSVPWGHLVVLLKKVKGDQTKALFYIRKTIENNWSRAVLLNFLGSHLYERTANVVTNFENTLPKENGDLARQLVKNPYNFDFLQMTEEYNERELKDALLANLQKFLLELGTGFAFVGREYRLNLGDTDLYADMLFYNTKIHAYVVVEVKVTPFKPDYVGQLGTYVVAVDHMLRTDRDEKTIGILICKDQSEVTARYALESSSQPLGVSSFEFADFVPPDYKSSLPTIEELEEELKDK